MKKSEFNAYSADSLINLINKVDQSWRKQWADENFQQQGFTGHIYRGENAFNTFETAVKNNYTDPRWLTFNQIKENGYTLPKGSQGLPISFFKQNAKILVKDENLKPVLDEDGNKTYANVPLFKPYYVFNASIIQGIEPFAKTILSEEEKEKLKQEKFKQADQMIKAFCENYNIDFHEVANPQPFHQQLLEYENNTVKSRVVLPLKAQFKNVESWYAVAFHEIGHATRKLGIRANVELDTPLGNTFGSKNYAIEELTAELTSLQLCRAFNLDSSELGELEQNSLAYIRNWYSSGLIEKSDVELAIKNSNTAFKAIYSEFEKLSLEINQVKGETIKKPEIENNRSEKIENGKNNIPPIYTDRMTEPPLLKETVLERLKKEFPDFTQDKVTFKNNEYQLFYNNHLRISINLTKLEKGEEQYTLNIVGSKRTNSYYKGNNIDELVNKTHSLNEYITQLDPISQHHHNQHKINELIKYMKEKGFTFNIKPIEKGKLTEEAKGKIYELNFYKSKTPELVIFRKIEKESFDLSLEKIYNKENSLEILTHINFGIKENDKLIRLFKSSIEYETLANAYENRMKFNLEQKKLSNSSLNLIDRNNNVLNQISVTSFDNDRLTKPRYFNNFDELHNYVINTYSQKEKNLKDNSYDKLDLTLTINNKSHDIAIKVGQNYYNPFNEHFCDYFRARSRLDIDDFLPQNAIRPRLLNSAGDELKNLTIEATNFNNDKLLKFNDLDMVQSYLKSVEPIKKPTPNDDTPKKVLFSFDVVIKGKTENHKWDLTIAGKGLHFDPKTTHFKEYAKNLAAFKKEDVKYHQPQPLKIEKNGVKI